MGASRKSKRLTWASGVNLRQVRLFSWQEPPSVVGKASQNHLRVKPNDDVPPGFEIIRPAIRIPRKWSQIPSTKWRCPPKFVIDSEHRVASGGESEEIMSQNHRQLRVLEAIYPRPSSIPTNPTATNEAYANVDIHNIPVIPITPIEEEEEDNPAATDAHLHNTTGIPTTPAVPNIIDPHLLIEFLNNPKLVEQLLNGHGTSSSATPYTANANPPLNPIVPSVAPNGPFYPLVQTQTGFIPKVQSQPPYAKRDVDYYKRLIQQHGEEKHVIEPTTREVKIRTIRKPCLYFSSAKGCRNGENCSYQHIKTAQKRFSDVSEVRSGKRIKLDSPKGITTTT